jgi:hypothetical protein
MATQRPENVPDMSVPGVPGLPELLRRQTYRLLWPGATGSH